MLSMDLLWETCVSEGVLKPRTESNKKGLSRLAEAVIGKPLDRRNEVLLAENSCSLLSNLYEFCMFFYSSESCVKIFSSIV